MKKREFWLEEEAVIREEKRGSSLDQTTTCVVWLPPNLDPKTNLAIGELDLAATFDCAGSKTKAFEYKTPDYCADQIPFAREWWGNGKASDCPSQGRFTNVDMVFHKGDRAAIPNARSGWKPTRWREFFVGRNLLGKNDSINIFGQRDCACFGELRIRSLPPDVEN